MICKIDIKQYAKDIDVTEEAIMVHFKLPSNGLCVATFTNAFDGIHTGIRTFSDKQHRTSSINKKYIIPFEIEETTEKEK